MFFGDKELIFDKPLIMGIINLTPDSFSDGGKFLKKNSLIEISKKVFGKFIKDPSNLDPKYLRTKIRNLKTPLKKSG